MPPASFGGLLLPRRLRRQLPAATDDADGRQLTIADGSNGTAGAAVDGPMRVPWHGRFRKPHEQQFNSLQLDRTILTRIICAACLAVLQAIIVSQLYTSSLHGWLEAVFITPLVLTVLLLAVEIGLLVQRRRFRRAPSSAAQTAVNPVREARVTWLTGSGVMDLATVVVATAAGVAYEIAVYGLCSGSVLAIRSPVCLAYSVGFVPAPPFLWPNIGAGLIALTSSQPLLNALGVLACFGTAIGTLAAYFRPAPAPAMAAIGGPAIYYLQLAVLTILPLLFNMATLLAVGIQAPRSVRSHFALQRYTEAQAKRQLEMQAASALTRETAVRANTTALVSDAVMSYTCHALRNPIHVLTSFFSDAADTSRSPLLAATRKPRTELDVAAALPPLQAGAASKLVEYLPAEAALQHMLASARQDEDAEGEELAATACGGPPVAPRAAPLEPETESLTVQWAEIDAMQAALRRMSEVTQEAGFYSALIGRQVPVNPHVYQPVQLVQSVLRQEGLDAVAGITIDPGVPMHAAGDSHLIAEALARGLRNAASAARKALGDSLELPEDVTAAARAHGMQAGPITVHMLVVHDTPVADDDWLKHPGASILANGSNREAEVASGSTAVDVAAPVEVANSAVVPQLPRQQQRVPFLRFEVLNVGSGLPAGETAETLFAPFFSRSRDRQAEPAGTDAAVAADASGHGGTGPLSATDIQVDPVSTHWHTRSMGLGLPVVRLIASLLRGRCGIADEARLPPLIRQPSLAPVTGMREAAGGREASVASLPWSSTSDVSADSGKMWSSSDTEQRSSQQSASAQVIPLLLTRFVLQVPLSTDANAANDAGDAASRPAEAPMPSARAWTHGMDAHQATSPAPPTADSRHSPVQSRLVDLHGTRVLVVEDEAAVRKVNERLLRRLGCEVDVATDGDEVLPLLQAQEAAGRRYDAIMMDVIMQRQNGDDTCMQLRRSGYASLPIVAVTANAGPGDLRRYRDVGFSAVLTKPFDVAQCARTLIEVGVARRETP